MEKNTEIKLQIDCEKIVLSSKYDILKTQEFIRQTKYLLGTDFFISKLAESVISFIERNKTKAGDEGKLLYKLEDPRREHSFSFRIFNAGDTRQIVFSEYKGNDGDIRRNDRRFLAYAKVYPSFEMTLGSREKFIDEAEFAKLYHISNSDNVNFPLLTKSQRSMVEKQDENLLVQGVAGSGKTNICINKIVYAASEGYRGKVLYTTFSRGLLIDTQTKINIFSDNIKNFLSAYNAGRVTFLDGNKKAAIEKKLGVYLSSADSEANLIKKLTEVGTFLDKQVEYKLLEDFYLEYIADEINIADENYFIKSYIADIKNHQLRGKLQKLQTLSYEVVFKEIYGVIYGCCDPLEPKREINLEDYTKRRAESFSNHEAEVIFSLAQDFKMHMIKNKMVDNNIIARELLDAGKLPKYSLAIVDEVQDLTEIVLFLIKQLTIKIFAVGDALQMINPSFFSFSYLKRLMFEKDIVTVKELAHNYRNSKKIVEIIDELGKINVKNFGTHSFVIKGKCVDTSQDTKAVYVSDKDFIKRIGEENFDDVTIIVSNYAEKERLRKQLKKQEILTVSEVKGLERDTVILYNVLSSNLDKWKEIERTTINRKVADENSVYRYYFNLFYVGVTRAKANLFVTESDTPISFREFFRVFEQLPRERAIEALASVAGKIQIDEESLLERVEQFLKLEQYDNAKFTAFKIMDNDVRTRVDAKIEVSEKFIRHAKYREAGIAYWEKGMFAEAKEMFRLSGDTSLIDLLDASIKNSSEALNVDIVSFYPNVLSSEAAKKLILKAVSDDLAKLKSVQKEISLKLKSKSNSQSSTQGKLVIN